MQAVINERALARTCRQYQWRLVFIAATTYVLMFILSGFAHVFFDIQAYTTMMNLVGTGGEALLIWGTLFLVFVPPFHFRTLRRLALISWVTGVVSLLIHLDAPRWF